MFGIPHHIDLVIETNFFTFPTKTKKTAFRAVVIKQFYEEILHCSQCRILSAFHLFKFMFMFFKKIKINLRIFQMRPTFHDPGMIIQVDDLCPRECQQEGRVGADDQLIPAVTDGFCQKISQNKLVLRTQAIFRFIQQAQGVHLDLALEMHERTFPVGPFP